MWPPSYVESVFRVALALSVIYSIAPGIARAHATESPTPGAQTLAASGQAARSKQDATSTARSPPTNTVSCSSTLGARTQCAADTSKGVVLLRSTGEAPCLLGRTWGYDHASVWVSDGCGGEFVVAGITPAAAAAGDSARAAETDRAH